MTWSAGNTPMTASGSIGLQNVRGQSDGGSGIALRGLGQNLPLGNFGKLADDFLPQMIVGQNPDALRRKHADAGGRRFAGSASDRRRMAELVWRWRAGCAARIACRGRRPESGRSDASFYWIGIPANQLQRPIPACSREEVLGQIDEVIRCCNRPSLRSAHHRTRKSPAACR